MWFFADVPSSGEDQPENEEAGIVRPNAQHSCRVCRNLGKHSFFYFVQVWRLVSLCLPAIIILNFFFCFFWAAGCRWETSWTGSGWLTKGWGPGSRRPTRMWRSSRHRHLERPQQQRQILVLPKWGAPMWALSPSHRRCPDHSWINHSLKPRMPDRHYCSCHRQVDGLSGAVLWFMRASLASELRCWPAPPSGSSRILVGVRCLRRWIESVRRLSTLDSVK